jgi:hypothetical protein
MKLPNYEQVVITREKVVDYLLSDTHRDGRHKAAFFKRLDCCDLPCQDPHATLGPGSKF